MHLFVFNWAALRHTIIIIIIGIKYAKESANQSGGKKVLSIWVHMYV